MSRKPGTASPKKSGGILLYRFQNARLELFLVHPGGPFWAKKDEGAWSIPKGEFADDEDPLAAAKREIREETGIDVDGDFIELTPVKQKSGKLVYAWALQKDVDPLKLQSNHFEMEWPPRSGKKRSFPEVDKAGWFEVEQAKLKILPGQVPLINELGEKLAK